MDQIDQNYFLLTFDVEDWFQVENLKSCIPFSSWDSCELRVEKNVHQILDLLDEVSVKSPQAERASCLIPHANKKTQVVRRKAQGDENLERAESMEHNKPIEAEGKRQEAWSLMPQAELASRLTPDADFDSPHALTPSRPHDCEKLPPASRLTPHATFFVLGWIAERLPHLVKEIVQRGHEVASHGYNHQLCHLSSTESLTEDFVNSKNLLEDLIGSPINGYRAPSFSINPEVINLLRENGYQYDSSFNSFGINSRYGKLSLNDHDNIGIAFPLSGGFFELPVSNLVLGKKILPLGGGGYFRLIPFPIFRWGVKTIFKKKSAYLFYFHPWELDPDQPRVEAASRLSQFRHYLNLDKTASRLSKLITAFKDCCFVTCSQYLEEIKHVRA